MKSKIPWPLIIGFPLSGVCLYFAFRGISLQEAITPILQANFLWILLSLVVYSLGFLVRALRWKIIFQPIQQVSALRLFPLLMIGFFGNNVLPLRMGELLRAHVCGRQLGVSRTACLGTIMLERFMDMLTFAGLFTVNAFFFTFPEDIQKAAKKMGIISGIGLAGTILLLTGKNYFKTVIGWFPLSPRIVLIIQKHFESILQGLSGLRTVKAVVQIILLSMLVWSIEASFMYGIAHALGMEFSFGYALFLLFCLAVAVALPQAPGFVGTMEFFGVMALGLLGFEKGPALSLILCIHALQFLFIIVVGVWSLWKEGLSFQSILSTK